LIRPHQYLPTAVIAAFAGAALLHGPVAQLPNYHDFADQQTVFGIPHFTDVVSNLGFILVALWGWLQLRRAKRHPELACGWAGYQLFLIGLFLTGLGSAYYHLAPDNARLVWDRLPIALACGGLMAGVWGDTRRQNSWKIAAWLAFAAIASVAWWHFTEQAGAGDLRPYLLLQGLPIIVIPLWQWIHRTPRADCWALTLALLLYAMAKFAEINDHGIAAALGILTGHNLKHLLAGVAAALVVANLVRRAQTPLPVVVASGRRI
jgi:hypothetical protein